MNKIILIPDSFKGTMSSREICTIMDACIRKHYPHAQILSIPVADGGEGSVECFLAALQGERVTATVKGPYFEDMEATYGILPDGSAVIEMAACAGLPLVGDRLCAQLTTTYGVGQLIAHAAKRGVKKIIVGLGGSATNDGGTGMAAALGVQFFRKNGTAFVPTGATLQEISKIDLSGLLPELSHIALISMCDIDNPLCGEHGAAHVFGPQKGASPDMVKYLDQGLAHLANVVLADIGMEISNMPGAGAAGGMGGGMVAFLGAKLQMGIETVLDAVGFDALLQGADLVISGEGKIDRQSLRGKVVVGVARRTKPAGIPLVAIVGDIGDDIEEVYHEGVTGIFSINRVALPFDQAKKRSETDLRLTVDNLFRYMKAIEKVAKKLPEVAKNNTPKK